MALRWTSNTSGRIGAAGRARELQRLLRGYHDLGEMVLDIEDELISREEGRG